MPRGSSPPGSARSSSRLRAGSGSFRPCGPSVDGSRVGCRAHVDLRRDRVARPGLAGRSRRCRRVRRESELAEARVRARGSATTARSASAPGSSCRGRLALRVGLVGRLRGSTADSRARCYRQECAAVGAEGRAGRTGDEHFGQMRRLDHAGPSARDGRNRWPHTPRFPATGPLVNPPISRRARPIVPTRRRAGPVRAQGVERDLARPGRASPGRRYPGERGRRHPGDGENQGGQDEDDRPEVACRAERAEAERDARSAARSWRRRGTSRRPWPWRRWQAAVASTLAPVEARTVSGGRERASGGSGRVLRRWIASLRRRRGPAAERPGRRSSRSPARRPMTRITASAAFSTTLTGSGVARLLGVVSSLYAAV